MPHVTKARLPLHIALLFCLLGVGCSFHSSFSTGSSTSEDEAREAREHDEHEGHEHAHVRPHVQGGRGEDDTQCTPDNERCTAAKRKADEDLARVERETNERVAQAERDAKDQERQTEEQAERDRQQARAEADAKQHEADAAAAAQAEAKPRVMRKNELGGTAFHKGPEESQNNLKRELQESLERRNGEIDSATFQKKTVIRKQLDQTKADILVAAERKRNEIHAQLKEDASAKP